MKDKTHLWIGVGILVFLLVSYFVKIPVAGQNLYLINNTEAIHQVLVTQSAHFERTSRFRRAFSAIVGEGIMTMEKKEHQARRQLVQPAFHHRYIQHYAETMVEETNRMFNQWRDGQVIHANREMMNLTLSVVTKTLFGSDITLESDAIGEAILTNIEDFEDRLFNFLPTDWLPTAKNKKRKAAKQLVFDVAHKTIDDSLMASTSEKIAAIRVSEEGQEGLGSFFDKRAPKWQQEV